METQETFVCISTRENAFQMLLRGVRNVKVVFSCQSKTQLVILKSTRESKKTIKYATMCTGEVNCPLPTEKSARLGRKERIK